MTNPVNLRQVRKQRDRDARRAQADANAARHGEPKALREAREAEARRADQAHAAHRQEAPDAPPRGEADAHHPRDDG